MIKARGALRGAALALVFGAGCTGPYVHKDLGAGLTHDRDVLSRHWTLSTAREGRESGDRGSEFSNPVVSDNVLYFGNRTEGLMALYPTLGQARWTLPVPGGVTSEIAVEGGLVYFGGGDGFLYAVQADVGKVAWRYEVRNPTLSRPVVSAGRLFVTTSDDVVYAFDAATGKWLWHYRRRSAAASTIHGASAPLVDGQDVLAGLSDGFLVALGIADGQLKWEKKLHFGSKFTDVDAGPVIDGGVVYVPSYDGALYALKRQSGEILWKFDAGGSRDILVEEQKLYLPSTDGKIYAVQKSNGRELWKFEMDGGTPTRLVATERHLVVGSSYQFLYVLDKATGKALSRFNVGWGSGFVGSPAYDPRAKLIFALSSTGNLYSFSLRDPEKLSGTKPLASAASVGSTAGTPASQK